MSCEAFVEGDQEWNETLSNEGIVYGNCSDGYSISKTCIQYGEIGNWTSLSDSCKGISLSHSQYTHFFSFWLPNLQSIGVYCRALENDENARWYQTLADGQTVEGICINGYHGSISRTCAQSDENGDWGLINGSCNGISFLLLFFLAHFELNYKLN